MKTAKEIYYYLASSCIAGSCREYCKGTDSVACSMVQLASNMSLRGEY